MASSSRRSSFFSGGTFSGSGASPPLPSRCVRAGSSSAAYAPGSKSAASKTSWIRGDARAETRVWSVKKLRRSGIRRYGAVRYCSSSSASRSVSSAAPPTPAPDAARSSVMRRASFFCCARAAASSSASCIATSDSEGSPSMSSSVVGAPFSSGARRSEPGSAADGGARVSPPSLACIAVRLSALSSRCEKPSFGAVCTCSTRPFGWSPSAKPRTSSAPFSPAAPAASPHDSFACSGSHSLRRGSASRDGDMNSLKRNTVSRNATSSGNRSTSEGSSPVSSFVAAIGSPSSHGKPSCAHTCATSVSSAAPKRCSPLVAPSAGCSQQKSRCARGATAVARSTDAK